MKVKATPGGYVCSGGYLCLAALPNGKRLLSLTLLAAQHFFPFCNAHHCRSLQESSEAVQQLVPVVLLQSGKVADNPQNLSHLDELKEGGKDLVQKLHFFAEVMDKGALPWSQCAQRVIGSATTQRQMEAEVSHEVFLPISLNRYRVYIRTYA